MTPAPVRFQHVLLSQACRTMKEEYWIDAHIAMHEFFGVAARILPPNNLKVGIFSNRKYEDPDVNRSHQEITAHDHTALFPARLLPPHDKADVEGSVGSLTSAPLPICETENFFTHIP